MRKNARDGRFGSGRPTADGAKARREHIVQIACDLFLEQGYAATSLEAVATGASVSKVTIYRHFSNKYGLFLAVVDSLIAVALPGSLPMSGAEDPRTRLTAFAEAFFDDACRPEAIALARLIYGEAGRFPEIGKAYEERRQDLVLALLRSDLERWRADGVIVCTDIGKAAEIFSFMASGMAMQRGLCALRPAQGEAEREATIALAVNLFLKGCSGV